MKRFSILLLCALLLFCACDNGSIKLKLKQAHELPLGITLMAPTDWKVKETESEFDLYLEDSKGTLFLAVYVYDRDELVQGMSATNFFDAMNSVPLSNTDSISNLRPNQRRLVNDYDRYTRICAVRENEKEYGYYFGTADFGETLVWFMGSSDPETIRTYAETFDAILEGIRPTQK
jgi:hypothetical protein